MCHTLSTYTVSSAFHSLADARRQHSNVAVAEPCSTAAVRSQLAERSREVDSLEADSLEEDKLAVGILSAGNLAVGSFPEGNTVAEEQTY